MPLVPLGVHEEGRLHDLQNLGNFRASFILPSLSSVVTCLQLMFINFVQCAVAFANDRGKVMFGCVVQCAIAFRSVEFSIFEKFGTIFFRVCSSRP